MTDIDIGKLRVAAENAPKGAWSQGCMIGFIHTVRPPVVLAILTEIEALREVAEKARTITEYSALNAMDRWEADGHAKSPEYSAMIGASRDALTRLAAVQETPAPDGPTEGQPQ